VNRDRTPLENLKKFDWFHSLRKIDNRFLLRHSSLDVYLWTRFLKLLIFICFIGCCISWPVLFPVNATGGGKAEQLDKISFTNIKNKNRLWAHAAVAWVFLGMS